MLEIKKKSLKTLLESTKRFKTPSKSDVVFLCQQVIQLLSIEPNVVHVSGPVTICGNIQGSLDDLLEIFKISGEPPETNYIFLGSYVNVGRFSVEVLSVLFIFKLLYPSRLTLLRGSHECAGMSQNFGFFQEILEKFGDSEIFESFLKVFNSFPLVAVVASQVFCVHSGISFMADTLDELMKVDRFSDLSADGPATHLLWNTPFDGLGWQVFPKSNDFGYGTDILSEFLNRNGLKMMVRSHQLVMEGFAKELDGLVVTIFSTSNYRRMKNFAVVLRIDEDMNQEFLIFDWKFKEKQGFVDDFPDYFQFVKHQYKKIENFNQ